MAPSAKQKSYVQKFYKDYKTDLFAVFEKKCKLLNKVNGYQTMIILPSFLFLSSFENARTELLNTQTICSLLHMGRGIFGVDFGSTSFVLLNNRIDDYKGKYFRLHERTFQFLDPDHIAQLYLDSKKNPSLRFNFQSYDTKNEIKYSENGLQLAFCAYQKNFSKIPGSPIAYWVSKKFLNSFEKEKLSKYGEIITGMTIGDNNKYLRLWYEVKENKIAFKKSNMNLIDLNETNWIPYSKGGQRRNWYGNYDYIVNWSQNMNFNRPKSTMKHLYLKRALTWPFITSGKFSARRLPEGSLWDVAGSPCFFEDKRIENTILAFLCSKLSDYILNVINPTINVQAIDINNLPFEIDDFLIDNCNLITEINCELSKDDWDSFETSWDFKIHPFVTNHVSTVSEAYSLWDKECNERFNQLKDNEEELNRIFIDIYGLQDELTPEVEDKDVTVRKADLVRDVKSFISYAVGCIFGRYSLDVEGLAYAGGEWDDSKYTTFIPDKDDIIPICDEEYFEDDIVSRFIEFVSVVYGSDTLEENLKFIADALGGKGTPREALRNYFLNDFFKDHCNTYQVTGSGKRPIYWLFDSGKKNGFKALVYIHRYTPDLIARMRTGYIHPQQARYRTQIELLQEQIDMAGSTSEKVKLSKQLKKINEQLLELNKYEEIVHHWADKMEPMDLDDGVKVNYAKFQKLLAKIK